MTSLFERRLALTLLVTLAASGCAKAPDQPAVAAKDSGVQETVEDTSSSKSLSVPTDSESLTRVAVTSSAGLTVSAVKNDEQSTAGGNPSETVKIPQGAVLTVLERKTDVVQGDLVRVGVDSDDETVPSDLWVKASDLDPAQLAEATTVKSPENADVELTRVAETGSEINGDIQQLIENASRHGGIPSCYKDVKHELLRRHLVNTYPPGAAAYMGYDILRRNYGFTPVKFSQNLPDGAVCVSEGGPFNCGGGHKCGHIAIKIGFKRWYGAGTFPTPLLRGHSNMRCLVKKSAATDD